MRERTRIKPWIMTAIVLLVFIPYALGFMGFNIGVHLKVYTYAPALLGYCVFLLLVLALVHGKNALKSIGLDRNIGKAFLFALVCTVPMFLMSACTGKIDSSRFSSLYKFVYLLNMTVAAGFCEEFCLRGFLFGQLFRYCKWGYVPALLLEAVVFGAGHLYQGYDLLSSASVFLVTALGALFFSWVYVESGYNLWTSIFLHTLMNLSWLLFTTDHFGAVGNVLGKVARVVTVGLAIGWIIWQKKKHGVPFVINKNNWWVSELEA